MDVESLALGWLLSRFGKSPELAENLFQTGVLDSLSFNELLTYIETETGREIDFSRVANWDDLETISGLAAEFNRQL